LTHALNRGRTILSLHQQNLISLKDVQNRFQATEWVEYPKAQEELETKRTYQSFSTNVSLSLSRASPTIDENIAAIETEVLHLRQNLIEFEDTLLGWKFSSSLSKDSIHRLSLRLKDSQSILQSARVALSPIRRIPREIWSIVFRKCLLEELEEFVMRPGAMPFRSVPSILAKVCASWHNIVTEDPNMWSYVSVYPKEQITPSDFNLLSKCLSKASKHFTMIVNLSQIDVLGSTDYGSHPLFGQKGVSLTSWARELAIPIGKSYSLHLIANDDSTRDISKISSIPFRRPRSLVLEITSKGNQGNMMTLLDHFQGINQLEIRDKGARLLSMAGLPTRLPHIISLKLHVDDMPSVEMVEILHPNLVELQIRHNCNNRINKIENILRLSELRFLGINHVEVSLLDNLDAPGLQELELYGSKQNFSEISFGSTLQAVLSRIRQLSFTDWKVQDQISDSASEPSTSECVAKAFTRLASSLSSIRALKFTNCQIRGGILAQTFESHLDLPNSWLTHLETVQFENCSLITREEYEAIGKITTNIGFCTYIHDRYFVY
jgi:hypothetical protein